MFAAKGLPLRTSYAATILLAVCAVAAIAPPYDDPLPDKTANKNGSPAGEGRNSDEQPPQFTPRTLPEALHAYFECLRTHGWEKTAEEPTAAGKRNGQNGQDEKNKDEAQDGGGNKQGAEKKKSGDDEKGNDEAKGNDKANEKEAETPAWYSAHAQGTVVVQAHDHFRSPYIGPHSLLPAEPTATSMTATLYLDYRLWQGDGHSTELIFNPEIAGGKGLSGVVGIAGFPNGEITRVGAFEPTPYIARLFVRQTCGLGGEQEKVEDEPNEIAGMRDVERLTLSVGKFSATDFVDDNKYSHDPRTQFLAWSIMYNGAWDYPANVRGYTYGFAIDYNQKNWAIRYGIFAEPTVANGAPLDPRFLKANGQVLEWEGRYTLADHPGRLRLLGYLNHAHMGDYSEALGSMPLNPDITLTRDYRYKYGFGLSWEQEVRKDLGVFGRLGWSDGHTETWAFTAIDRLAEIGLLLNGRCWCRPNDQVGVAVATEGLAGPHRDYLAAGGLDYIIGDGRLRYGPEDIAEAFYNFEVRKGIVVGVDFQEVNHPAYNRDRGPVFIAALRVHLEY